MSGEQTQHRNIQYNMHEYMPRLISRRNRSLMVHNKLCALIMIIIEII